MKERGHTAWLVVLVALVASPLAAGTYLGGLGQVTVVDGREVCGTDQSALNALDHVSYSIAAVTEFVEGL